MKIILAAAKEQLLVQYLQDMVVLELGSRTVYLHELMLWLKTLTRNDVAISLAMSRLSSSNTIDIGVDRVVRLNERSMCFICGEPRAEGSEWCEDHAGPEGS